MSGRSVAATAAAILLGAGACAGAGPTVDAVEALGMAGTCDELHTLALTVVTRDGERARQALPEVGDLDAAIDALLAEDVPDEVFGSALGLSPRRPYGGVAGDAVVERYDELGCTPEEEYQAILTWFGVEPPQTAEDLQQVVGEQLDDAGAGSFGLLGLARRVLEGTPTSADVDELVAVLDGVVAAQERHRARTGTYAEWEDDLEGDGLDPALLEDDSPMFLWIIDADEDAYCMAVSGPRGSAYVESHDATPVVEDRPFDVVCAETFPDRE